MDRQTEIWTDREKIRTQLLLYLMYCSFSHCSFISSGRIVLMSLSIVRNSMLVSMRWRRLRSYSFWNSINRSPTTFALAMRLQRGNRYDTQEVAQRKLCPSLPYHPIIVTQEIEIVLQCCITEDSHGNVGNLNKWEISERKATNGVSNHW